MKEQLEKWKELLKNSGKNRWVVFSSGRSPSAGDLHSERREEQNFRQPRQRWQMKKHLIRRNTGCRTGDGF